MTDISPSIDAIRAEVQDTANHHLSQYCASLMDSKLPLSAQISSDVRKAKEEMLSNLGLTPDEKFSTQLRELSSAVMEVAGRLADGTKGTSAVGADARPSPSEISPPKSPDDVLPAPVPRIKPQSNNLPVSQEKDDKEGKEKLIKAPVNGNSPDYSDPKAYDRLPHPADRGPFTKNGRYLDPRLASLHVGIEEPNVAPGEQYWKVKSIEYQNNTQFTEGITESGGRLNMYYALKDSSGRPVTGANVVQGWPDGTVKAGVDGGGGANIPMGPGGTYWPEDGQRGPYSAWVDGMPSEKVTGLGLPGRAHVSYVFTYELATKT